MTDGQRAPQRVVCAAIRKGDVVVIGARHFDGMMHRQLEAMGRKDLKDAEQGFIDQFGNFLTRQEAWWIAVGQGQLVRLVGSQTPESRREGADLYSENLY